MTVSGAGAYSSNENVPCQREVSASTGRLVCFDIARGLVIILVVFGHAWRGIANSGIIGKDPFFSSVDSGIYLFHMPVFFLISGFFFESQIISSFFKWIMGRIEALLYPEILWSLIMAIAIFLSGSVSNRGGMRLVDIPLYPLYPPQDIYWFLWALFQIQVLGWLVQAIPRNFVLPAATAISCLPPLVHAASTPLLISQVYMNLPFFLLGMLLKRYGQPISGRSAVLLGAPLFISAEAWIIVHPDLLGTPAAFIPSLAAVAGFMLISVYMTEVAPKNVRRLLCFFSIISMTIYVAHIIPTAAVRIFLMKMHLEGLIVHLILQVAAGLGAPVLLYFVARRSGLLRILGLGRDRARTTQG